MEHIDRPSGLSWRGRMINALGGALILGTGIPMVLLFWRLGFTLIASSRPGLDVVLWNCLIAAAPGALLLGAVAMWRLRVLIARRQATQVKALGWGSLIGAGFSFLNPACLFLCRLCGKL